MNKKSAGSKDAADKLVKNIRCDSRPKHSSTANHRCFSTKTGRIPAPLMSEIQWFLLKNNVLSDTQESRDCVSQIRSRASLNQPA